MTLQATNRTEHRSVERCTLPLTKGKVAIVDASDFEWLNQWKWSLSSTGYAVRNTPRPNQRQVYMHRQITNAQPRQVVDHKNRDSLDNRRENLRLCTQRENMANKVMRGGTSAYKGVFWSKGTKKWAAQISAVKGKPKHLGYFTSEIDAAKAYDVAAQSCFGPFALLNFPVRAAL